MRQFGFADVLSQHPFLDAKRDVMYSGAGHQVLAVKYLTQTIKSFQNLRGEMVGDPATGDVYAPAYQPNGGRVVGLSVVRGLHVTHRFSDAALGGQPTVVVAEKHGVVAVIVLKSSDHERRSRTRLDLIRGTSLVATTPICGDSCYIRRHSVAFDRSTGLLSISEANRVDSFLGTRRVASVPAVPHGHLLTDPQQGVTFVTRRAHVTVIRNGKVAARLVIPHSHDRPAYVGPEKIDPVSGDLNIAGAFKDADGPQLVVVRGTQQQPAVSIPGQTEDLVRMVIDKRSGDVYVSRNQFDPSYDDSTVDEYDGNHLLVAVPTDASVLTWDPTARDLLGSSSGGMQVLRDGEVVQTLATVGSSPQFVHSVPNSHLLLVAGSGWFNVLRAT